MTKLQWEKWWRSQAPWRDGRHLGHAVREPIPELGTSRWGWHRISLIPKSRRCYTSTGEKFKWYVGQAGKKILQLNSTKYCQLHINRQRFVKEILSPWFFYEHNHNQYINLSLLYFQCYTRSRVSSETWRLLNQWLNAVLVYYFKAGNTDFFFEWRWWWQIRKDWLKKKKKALKMSGG